MVIEIAGGATSMLNDFVANPPPVSATRTVNGVLPAFCGVPVIAPDEFRERPRGGEPTETVHVYEPDPPVAASDAE